VPGTHVPYPVEEVHKNEPEYARLKRVHLMVPIARAIRTRVSHVEQIIVQVNSHRIKNAIVQNIVANGRHVLYSNLSLCTFNSTKSYR
jgi:hypothetical protein